MLSSFVFLAFFAYGSLAQKKGEIPHQTIQLPQKAQISTPPRLIDESPHKKECPAGFQFVGKQCAKTLTAPADSICTQGSIKVDGGCAKYLGKERECPNGFIEYDKQCIRREAADLLPVCPAGFDLIGKDRCVKKVALPDIKECPAGSLVKGDVCVKGVLEAPEYVCAPGYNLVGRKCQRESTFDCTPIRKPSLPLVGAVEEKKGENLLRNNFDNAFGGNIGKGKEGSVYHLQVAQPSVEEYVIQETCKRIITEDAHAICANDGNFNGKMCEKDIIVPEVTRPGGFRDLNIAAGYACPDGFLESDSKNGCLATEYAAPELFCPAGTIDLGDKCAIYSQPKTICPEGFYLDGKSCTKTVFVAPLVEYTLTYTCTGKDCGHHIGK